MLENLAFLQLQGDQADVFLQVAFFVMHSVSGFLGLAGEGNTHDSVSEITDLAPFDFCGIMSNVDCWGVLAS
jgi:hypothetical protein